jgi:hypothetical protein
MFGNAGLRNVICNFLRFNDRKSCFNRGNFEYEGEQKNFICIFVAIFCFPRCGALPATALRSAQLVQLARVLRLGAYTHQYCSVFDAFF